MIYHNRRWDQLIVLATAITIIIVIVLLEQRKVLPLTSTSTGLRLVAVWRPKEDRWYIVEAGSGGMKNPKKVIDKLTPRQFQNALDNGQYSFSW